jgi:hypothetical protein
MKEKYRQQCILKYNIEGGNRVPGKLFNEKLIICAGFFKMLVPVEWAA